MSTHVIYGERQSGKTTKAIVEFVKNRNNVFITFNGATKHYVEKMSSHFNDNNVVTYRRFPTWVVGRGDINNIIFDDYDCMLLDEHYNSYLRIRDWISPILPHINDIFIYSTTYLNDDVIIKYKKYINLKFGR